MTADSQDIKLRYYDLLVQLALQDDAYLEACAAYQEVWDTEEVKADEAREVNVRIHTISRSKTLMV
jgi:26S proteasome regulatory subunit N5